MSGRFESIRNQQQQQQIASIADKCNRNRTTDNSETIIDFVGILEDMLAEFRAMRAQLRSQTSVTDTADLESQNREHNQTIPNKQKQPTNSPIETIIADNRIAIVRPILKDELDRYRADCVVCGSRLSVSRNGICSQCGIDYFNQYAIQNQIGLHIVAHRKQSKRSVSFHDRLRVEALQLLLGLSDRWLAKLTDSTQSVRYTQYNRNKLRQAIFDTIYELQQVDPDVIGAIRLELRHDRYEWQIVSTQIREHKSKTIRLISTALRYDQLIPLILSGYDSYQSLPTCEYCNIRKRLPDYTRITVDGILRCSQNRTTIATTNLIEFSSTCPDVSCINKHKLTDEKQLEQVRSASYKGRESMKRKYGVSRSISENPEVRKKISESLKRFYNRHRNTITTSRANSLYRKYGVFNIKHINNPRIRELLNKIRQALIEQHYWDDSNPYGSFLSVLIRLPQEDGVQLKTSLESIINAISVRDGKQQSVTVVCKHCGLVYQRKLTNVIEYVARKLGVLSIIDRTNTQHLTLRCPRCNSNRSTFESDLIDQLHRVLPFLSDPDFGLTVQTNVRFKLGRKEIDLLLLANPAKLEQSISKLNLKQTQINRILQHISQLCEQFKQLNPAFRISSIDTDTSLSYCPILGVELDGVYYHTLLSQANEIRSIDDYRDREHSLLHKQITKWLLLSLQPFRTNIITDYEWYDTTSYKRQAWLSKLLLNSGLAYIARDSKNPNQPLFTTYRLSDLHHGLIRFASLSDSTKQLVREFVSHYHLFGFGINPKHIYIVSSVPIDTITSVDQILAVVTFNQPNQRKQFNDDTIHRYVIRPFTLIHGLRAQIIKISNQLFGYYKSWIDLRYSGLSLANPLAYVSQPNSIHVQQFWEHIQSIVYSNPSSHRSDSLSELNELNTLISDFASLLIKQTNISWLLADRLTSKLYHRLTLARLAHNSATTQTEFLYRNRYRYARYFIPSSASITITTS